MVAATLNGRLSQPQGFDGGEFRDGFGRTEAAVKRKLGGDVVGSHQVIDSRSLDWTTVSRSRASEKGDARLSDKEAVK